MTRWPGLLLALSIVGAPIVLAAPPSETDIVLMKDWTRQPLNSQGVPDTWTAHETTTAKKIQVDLKATPWLEWDWKVVALPDRADVRHRETSDAAAHIFVVWLRWSPPVTPHWIYLGCQPAAG